jgi:diguanylate cyclase (GGDEF)-like protein
MTGPAPDVDPFSSPTYAAEIGDRALFFVLAIVLAASVAVWAIPFPAPWPTPDPMVSALALVTLETIFNSAARFRRHGELASYLALDEPVVFAMLLLLDWKIFVFAVCVGEIAIAVSDNVRHRKPTKWYLRVFNGAMLILTGAFATTAYHIVPGGAPLTGGSWLGLSPVLALSVMLLVYKTLKTVLVEVVLDLANGGSPLDLRLDPRQLFSESVVLAIGIPLALCWSFNVWVASFALVSLAAGDVLLGIPEMEYRLRIDRRTGLRNAATFDDDFARAVAQAKHDRSTFALLVIDIDHFKDVNDTHGHAVGDDVIAHFAGVLAKHMRASDTLARVGGEEFAIVLDGMTATSAVAFAERLRESIATTAFPIEGTTDAVKMTASVGIAVFPNNGEDTRSLFHAADTALYVAKRNGRNAVQLCDSTPAPQAR